MDPTYLDRCPARIAGVAAALLLTLGCGSDGSPQGPGTPGPPPPPPLPRVGAFPGAEGYGAATLAACDRSNLQVFRVTTLADSGPGSLRHAIETMWEEALTVVVFEVAGYITLEKSIDITQGCLYVAGQTAPGAGITIRAPGFTALFLRGEVHDVVLRFLRLRSGHGGDKRGNVNVFVGSGHDVILDHLSLGWTTDKLLAITKFADDADSRPIRRVTVQRTLFHEVLADHPTAVQVSGEPRHAPPISEIDLHHNFFGHNSHRNPNVQTAGAKVVNNLIYNWNQGAGQSANRSVTDWIGNVFVPGPMTDPRFTFEITHDVESDDSSPSLYVVGNIGPHNTDPQADNWEEPSRMVARYLDPLGAPLPAGSRRDTPLPAAEFPIRIDPTLSVEADVLADVGANARVTCDGSWVRAMDAVDARILTDARQKEGLGRPPETELDVGGFPSVGAGEGCVDSDGDAMPDAFEQRYSLGIADPGDNDADPDGDGYTNLEEYLNGTPPR